MAVAYFTQHLPHGFWSVGNGGELAVMYCWAFFLLVFTGPGAYALDTRFGPRGPGYVRSCLRRSPRSPRTPRRWVDSNVDKPQSAVIGSSCGGGDLHPGFALSQQLPRLSVEGPRDSTPQAEI